MAKKDKHVDEGDIDELFLDLRTHCPHDRTNMVDLPVYKSPLGNTYEVRACADCYGHRSPKAQAAVAFILRKIHRQIHGEINQEGLMQ